MYLISKFEDFGHTFKVFRIVKTVNKKGNKCYDLEREVCNNKDLTKM